MPLITFFKNFNDPIADKLLDDTLQAIGSELWKTQIENLRKCLIVNDLTSFEKLKKSLPAFTPSGQFVGGRKLEYLKQYSSFVVLDIDKLDTEKLLNVKSIATQSTFCYACFISPSGKGLKILVKVSNPKESHKETFIQLQSHFEKLLNIEIDKSGKDITRLCFVSHDPEIYINTFAESFTSNGIFVQTHGCTSLADASPTDTPPLNASPANASQYIPNTNDIYTDAIRFTSQKESFTNGNRNNFVFLLANNLNRKGISESEALSLILRDYNYNDTEVKATIKSAYEHFNEHNQKNEVPQKKTEKPAPEKPKKERKRFTANKFVLAQEYIKKHFVIRRNVVTQEYECREINKPDFESMNENNIFIKMQISGLNLSLNNLVSLLKSDFIEEYNPFTEYFQNLPSWDGKTDYISFLTSFVKTKDRARFDNHFKKWIVRVVACALVDGVFNKQAFVLVHDKQNSGKSTFCRFLCPPSLNNYIAENLSIDKDSRILLCRNLLINLDELSTLSKVEINSLKSLFSKDKINERLPYDRRNSILPRRCSFIGSTNQVEFLNDETGSVRWLCFVIDEIDWNYSEKINIDLVYTQAYSLFKNGFEYNLTQDEVKENDEYNKQFQIVTSEKELINKFLRPGTKESHELFWTATDILLYIAHLTENKVKLSPVILGKSLKMTGFERIKPQSEQVYGYYIFRK